MVLRCCGIVVGVGVHALFCFTYRLFGFLKGHEPAAAASSSWLGCDLALALQFAIPHSALLLPAVRSRLVKSIPEAFYGCFFCAATCVSLLATIALWQDHPAIVWRAEGAARRIVEAAFLASWVALFYSLSLTGLGYQTGWTPWWHWLRRRPLPRRTFQPRALYRWLRHPVYLSFLGLLWFNPVLTLDRALLAGVWSAYIFVGSCLKDRRLLFYLGDVYREYQSRVAGYPGMLLGPLAKIPCNPTCRRGETTHCPLPLRTNRATAHCTRR